MFTINLLAVLVAAVLAFIAGFLLHGPILGKLWMKLADIHPTGNEKFKDMIPQMIWNLVANIATAFLLSVLYIMVSSSSNIVDMGVWGGIVCALLVWGFILASSSVEVIWMGRKFSLWLFESMCSLIVMTIMGIVIALW